MANNTNIQLSSETTGTDSIKKTLTFEDKVIKKIAGIATFNVDGVIATSGGLIGNIADRLRSNDDKGIDAEVGQKQVALDLNVVCEYGKNVPALFDTVIEKVSSAIHDMTGLDVVEVNMHVEDILSKADFNQLLESQKSQHTADANATAKSTYSPSTEDENYSRVQ